MKILIACESSGTVREALRNLGHDAWSCDLLPADDGSPHHIQGDAIEAAYSGEWGMMIAHPPCTYLTVSGLHWNKRVPGRAAKTEEALTFVQKLMDAPIEKIAIENPVGAISTRIRKADQYIQPYEFGDDASKKTGLWLKNLPPLVSTVDRFPGRIVEHNGKQVERWSNQTDSGQNRLAPSPDRWKERSKTYPGIADAMAHQWA
jgi:hypothetical protein